MRAPSARRVQSRSRSAIHSRTKRPSGSHVNTISGLDGRSRPRPPRIFASVLLLIGLALLAGGIRLASLGGSLYYAIAGAVLVASAVQLWRGQRWGAYLYGLLTLGTIVWAITESGFDGWALAPRVLPFLVLG